MKLTIVPLTPARWPALKDLFGPGGACNGCWCMYWRIGATYRKRPTSENRDAFQSVVKQGPPPGLLAFAGRLPVGWCQLTTRLALPWMDRVWRLKPVDEIPVWSITCFYVRKGYRRRGVSVALLRAAIQTARKAGAPALESYPLDRDLSPSATSTGFVSTFKKEGFTTVLRRSPERPIMRLEFKAS